MKKIKAFSLLELMIVLSIMGILMVSVSQGGKLLREAKIIKTVSQITALQASSDSLPLDASDEQIWNWLEENKNISKGERKASIGGIFSFQDRNTLILAGDNSKKGFLTLNEANRIKEKIDGTTQENTGIIKVKPGNNCPPNPNDNEASYILEIKV